MAKPAREQDLPPLHRSSALPGARSKQHQAADGSVLATQLAKHLDLSRQRVQQLVDEHVIAQLPNGKFDQDACRIAYLRWLRDPERRSARTQVDADFVRAKTELIAIRVREKRRSVVDRGATHVRRRRPNARLCRCFGTPRQADPGILFFALRFDQTIANGVAHETGERGQAELPHGGCSMC